MLLRLNKMTSIRTYNIQTNQNNGKTQAILNLYSEYKNYYSLAIQKQYSLYLQIGRTNGFIDTKNDKSKLSERFKRQVMQQAVGQLESWISNRNNRINDRIQNCKSLTNEQKRKLHLIKMFRIYQPQEFIVNHKKKASEIITITQDDISIFKAINRSVKWNLPSNKNVSMQLNNNTCKLIKKNKTKKNKAKSFEYWIELSSLIKGKKLLIPANSNKYLNDKLKNGNLLNSIRIDFKKNKPIFNIILQKKESKNGPKFKREKIGIDFGTKYLFALSTGQIYGVNFGNQLAKFDKRIQVLQKRLQKQKIKPNLSKRYRKLVQKCKDFIKNEINRNLNKIIKVHNPKELVFERLDFRHSKLSKSMNRILRKCGRSIIQSKLVMIKEDFKIEVTEVNSAYSSQECKRCKFVHKKNRKKRDNFNCILCNYTKHADIQASKNIETRSSCPVLRGKACKKTIKQYLFDQFKQNMLQCDELRNRFISPDRRAIFLEFNPNSFEEFAFLLTRNKQNLIKIQ